MTEKKKFTINGHFFFSKFDENYKLIELNRSMNSTQKHRYTKAYELLKINDKEEKN